uniref:Uncharacterized protein n=1 Tax=Arion vulgaris TaxID=1028688 RepID=A0A0B7A975_9EUPU
MGALWEVQIDQWVPPIMAEEVQDTGTKIDQDLDLEDIKVHLDHSLMDLLEDGQDIKDKLSVHEVYLINWHEINDQLSLNIYITLLTV